MTDKKSDPNQNPDAVDDTKWGEVRDDNYGYANKQERLEKRGLEDWEMVQTMNESKVSIPYWFIAIFIVLLIVAVGLTFPFWGNRPGYERPWFDWGIPAGVAWVVVMSFLIYYMVDLRHVLKEKKEKKKRAQEQNNNEAADDNSQP
jgi:flagellar biosynthesis/type III secretory pathway M-ring protein FliF/YscJ